VRDQATSAGKPPLRISPGGVLVVEGFGAALNVESSHLKVRSGTGHRIAEGTFPRVTKPRLRRVVVIAGPAGYLSIPAVRWIRGVGADLVVLAPDGDVLLAPGRTSPDDARLRRAQALAADSGVGLAISRSLIVEKISEQHRVVVNRFRETPDRFVRALGGLVEDAGVAPSLDELRQTEALAAALYFDAWKGLSIRWARRDEKKIPEHWRSFTGRGSPLANGPRMAADPVNALVNMASALLEVEAILALRTVGLDPGMGFGLHADQPARASAADDLMEPVRPFAEELVLDLIGTRHLSRRDFAEQSNGHVRIMPEFSGTLVQAWVPELGQRIAPWAEHVAAEIGKATGIGRLPTRLTESNRSAGRRKAARRARTRERVAGRMVPRRCRECGSVLPSTSRTYCDNCVLSTRIEEFDRARTKATGTLEALRREGADPAHGGEAASKRAETQRRHAQDRKTFETTVRELPAREVFARQILPTLQTVPVRAMAEATGLTRAYCSMIRRGLSVPHPRHWKALRELEGS